MLFHSSIRKELARSFVATLVVLITVVMSMMLIRSLGLAAKGSVNPRDVIMLMGYSVLGHLATIMTLSLFIAVTSTLSRMYRESEMAVWFASGKGLAGFIWPLLRFAWPILLGIAALALFVWPWASLQSQALRTQYEQRGDLERVAPGQFQENATGSRVFFIETSDDGKNTANLSATNTTATSALSKASSIFVSQIENGKQILTTARNARLDMIAGDQFLILNNGQRTDQETGSTEIKITEFEEYAVLIKANKESSSLQQSPRSLKTSTLIRTPTPNNLAELSWRLGLAIAAVNLLLIALVLSVVNPRAGRGLGLALALLSFVVYYNLLNVGLSRIATGRMQFTYVMLALHGGIFALTVLWLSARHWQWSWRDLLPTKSRNAATDRLIQS
jgi:lipopolysaccharide export system permease protein